MYDSTKLVIVDGSVNNFQWTNPHVLLWVTGATAAGEAPTLWTVELPTSPGNLGRMGWSKHSLKAGDHVIVELNPLRDGRHGGSFKKATIVATGKVLLANPVSKGADGGANYGPDEAKKEDAAGTKPKRGWGCAMSAQPCGRRLGGHCARARRLLGVPSAARALPLTSSRTPMCGHHLIGRTESRHP